MGAKLLRRCLKTEQPVVNYHFPPPATDSIITKKEQFLTAAINVGILVFCGITAIAWIAGGRGWPSFGLCVFIGMTILFFLLLKWFALLYIEEMRTRQARDHERSMRMLDSQDTRVVHEAPVLVQQAVNEGTRITSQYGYKTVKQQTKAAREERVAEHVQRDRDRDSADRNAALDREMRISLATLEGDQRLTLEMAQQVSETLMLIHDLETEGIDRELTRIIDSVANLRPTMETILNTADNPPAQRTLMELYHGTLTRGINEMIGAYAGAAFRRRSQRSRTSHDSVSR